jgi:GNAT superfamily N-acetyltransferase
MAPLDRTAPPASAAAITLRRARREDVPAIDAMHALSVRALGAADYTAAEIDAFLHSLGTYDPALIDDGTYFVLEHAGQVVASGGWSQRAPHAALPEAGASEGASERRGRARAFSLSPDSAMIRSVFVHPDYARLGLGSRVVRHAEAEAAAAGHRLLELWSTRTGVPLYRRLGYQDIAPIVIPCVNGAGVPALHMARLVPAASATAA